MEVRRCTAHILKGRGTLWKEAARWDLGQWKRSVRVFQDGRLATCGSGAPEMWLAGLGFWILFNFNQFKFECKWPQWLVASLGTVHGRALGQ